MTESSTIKATRTLVMTCQLAGVQYYSLEGLYQDLREGQPLDLKRERENQYDPLAIAVCTMDEYMLGHVPRAKNEVIARLMDAGHTFEAQVGAVIEKHRMDVDIYWIKAQDEAE